MQVKSVTRWILVVATVLGSTLALLPSLAGLENGLGLDLLYGLRGARTPPRPVVIIAIDSRSARILGQSERPERWQRSLHAQLVDGLNAAGARVIGFDVHFERAREADQDAALAAAIRRTGRVILVENVTRETIDGPGGERLAHLDKRTLPLPLLAASAKATGPFVLPKTQHGINEYWGYIPGVADHPSLPVLMAREMGTPHLAGLDNHPRPLNLYGPIGTIRTLSYADALALLDDPAQAVHTFQDKAVLVGFSESNQSRQSDIFHTPFSRDDGVDLSGVELAATAVANLLDGSALRRLPPPAETLLILGWVLALTLPWLLFGTRRALLASALLTLSWLSVAALAFAGTHWWLPVVVPVMVAPLLITAGGLLLHVHAARQRAQHLEHALDLGLTRRGSEKLATLLQGQEGGRTVHGVCLCSDMVSYTRFSEGLDPEASRNALNRYFELFIPIVETHGGHVMDIVGDAVMSLWLADDSALDACRRACQAALALDHLMNDAQAPSGAHPTRFGLHYGPVFLGEVGNDQHRELRAVGDIVNTTSRIQGCNKILGTHILASAAVCGRSALPHRNLGNFLMAGKQTPVELHEILSRPLPAPHAALFEDIRLTYAASAPHATLKASEAFLSLAPEDGPTRFFRQRSQERLRGLHPSDEGCVILATK
ncbi:adenylate/guanylate cyclase domain-containing protein [Zoogloea sp.]|uniref:CHASE2 domain-containing protein n=1 Tax=Zoogloea sp. TaxID=49181 RepID=UPI00262C997B|nr:adenylate/guanylate cyclase domain-containing protein [Zoogloea sp.]MDD3352353.1 adenylate/guanylate cyclase domain-containing protein [Zoogloea sp.]